MVGNEVFETEPEVEIADTFETDFEMEIDEDPDVRCPNCGAVIEDGYELINDNKDKKYDCDECGEVTFEETLMGSARRSVEEGTDEHFVPAHGDDVPTYGDDA